MVKKRDMKAMRQRLSTRMHGEYNVKLQRLTRRMIMKAKVKCERSVIESLREKGMEGGSE